MQNSTQIELLYRQHGAALVLYAAAIAGEYGRGQDAVQQVFLKLLEGRGMQQVMDTKAYLFTSVRNAVLNDLKTRQRTVTIDPEVAWFDPPNRDYVGEVNLRRALATLSDEQREVAIMHVWGELTFSQIAGVLDISANTAASRYRYALAKLRETMCAKEDPCANS